MRDLAAPEGSAGLTRRWFFLRSAAPAVVAELSLRFGAVAAKSPALPRDDAGIATGAKRRIVLNVNSAERALAVEPADSCELVLVEPLGDQGRPPCRSSPARWSSSSVQPTQRSRIRFTHGPAPRGIPCSFERLRATKSRSSPTAIRYISYATILPLGAVLYRRPTTGRSSTSTPKTALRPGSFGVAADPAGENRPRRRIVQHDSSDDYLPKGREGGSKRHCVRQLGGI